MEFILNFNVLNVHKVLNDLKDLKDYKEVSTLKNHNMSTDPQNDQPLVPRSGNYQKLFSYQKAEAIYDITYYFCSNFLKRGDRTVDQMVQAAR